MRPLVQQISIRINISQISAKLTSVAATPPPTGPAAPWLWFWRGNGLAEVKHPSPAYSARPRAASAIEPLAPPLAVVRFGRGSGSRWLGGDGEWLVYLDELVGGRRVFSYFLSQFFYFLTT